MKVRGVFVAMLAATAGASMASAQVPHAGHVIIVLGENAGFSQTYQTGEMPYLDSLAAKYGVAANYIADTHGSLYDYLLITSGQTLASSSQATPSDQMFAVDNIALDVQNAGKTWRDYIENLDSACGSLSSGYLEIVHDPLAYYSNINLANRVCFSQFAIDLANHALPNFSFLVPNSCDGGDSCSVATFDTWLKTEIAPLVASSYLQPGGDGLLIIPIDEDSNISASSCSLSEIEAGGWCGGQVETVIVSPNIVSPGYKSTVEYHHENVLRLMEEALGLTEFPGASSDPQGNLSPPIDMADFFSGSSGGGGGSGGGSGSSPSVVQVQNNIDDNSGNSYSTFSVNLASKSGDLLVAFVRESSNATDNFTVTDSAGQTWTLASSGYVNECSTGPRSAMFYRANSAAVSSVTAHFTTSGGVAKPGIMVMEISGAATSSVLDSSANILSGASVATSFSAALSTSNASDILIFATDTAGDQTGWTAGSGFTIPNNKAATGASGSNVRMAMQYRIVSSTETGTTTSTAYNSTAWNGNVFAAFKAGSTSGGSPGASLSATSLNFGNQTLGTTSSPKSLTLSNTGTATLDISGISISGTDSSDFTVTNDCGSSLTAGASCSITLTFSPTSSGTLTATLTVKDNAGTGAQTVGLSGSGTSSGSSSGPPTLAAKAYGAYHGSSSVTSVTSSAFAVPASGLIVAYCGVDTTSSMTPAVSDAAGNTFHQIGPTVASSGSDSLAMFYAAGAGASSSDTVTCRWSSGELNLAVMVLVYSGIATSSPVDVVATGTSLGNSSIQTGTFSTSSANEVVVAGMMSGSSCIAAPTAGSGYTMEISAVPSGCAGPLGAAEAEVASTQLTGATAAMGFSGNVKADMIAASFKAGSSGTSTALGVVQIQNNIDTSGSAFSSFSVPITSNSGDLLVALCRESSNGTDNFTVTDSNGKTWAQAGSYNNESASGPRLGMFYLADSAAVSNVTVHFTTSGGVIKPGIMVMEISGAALSGALDTTVNSLSGSATTTSSSAGLSTANANDILIFATDTAGDQTSWTTGSGYAIPSNKIGVGASGSNVRMAMQYKIVSSTASGATTSTGYANSAWNGNIFAAFK